MSGRAKYPPGALARFRMSSWATASSRLVRLALHLSVGGVFTPRNLLIASCISHWVMTLGGGYTRSWILPQDRVYPPLGLVFALFQGIPRGTGYTLAYGQIPPIWAK